MKISVTKIMVVGFEVMYFEDCGEEGMDAGSFSGNAYPELSQALVEWEIAVRSQPKKAWVIVTKPEVTIHNNPVKGT